MGVDMIKCRLIFGACLIVTVALSSANAAERVRALIPVRNIDESIAPFVVAKYLGYYEQDGLDVQLVAVGGSNEVAIQIGAGNGEVGEATPAQAVIGMQEGATAPLDVRYYYNVGYKNIWSMSVPSDSPIKSIADLKGKKIGITAFGSAGTTYGKAYLRSNGLDPDKDVTWIAIGAGAQAVAAIRQHIVDAIVFWDAAVARFEVGGLHLRQLKIDEKLERIPDISLLAKQETIKSKPQMLVGFARGLSKGIDFTLANPEAAILITWSLYPEAKPSDPDPKARLAQGMAILKPKIEGWVSPDAGGKHGLFITKDWETLGNFLLQEKQIAKPVPTSRMFTNALIDEINAYDRQAVLSQAATFDVTKFK
jgi:NitT/TauT family transport system substrate-binding protein